MKIIFLDFDGVLNSQKYFMERHNDIIEYCNQYKNDPFNPEFQVERQLLNIDVRCLNYLLKIIHRTHAKVVVISSWKILTIFPVIIERLKRLGVPIIGVTEDDSIHRGDGIKKYLENNNVKNYIILDDEIFVDYDEELLEHLVKTSFYEDGLNEETMNEAIDKLKEKVLVKKRKLY
jgi:hypothetical protein